MITSFKQLLEEAKKNKPMRLAGAAAQDVNTLAAMSAAEKAGIIVPILIGDIPTIEKAMKDEGITFENPTFVQGDDFVDSCDKAVAMVREGKADFLMKGLCDTNIFLKAILNKEHGLPLNGTLCHVMTVDTHGAYKKLMITADGGMLLAPTLEQKASIIKSCVTIADALGITEPKVAVLCAKEKLNPKMPATVDAAELAKMGAAGDFGSNVTVAGPIAMDLAVSKHAADIKGYESPVCGDADIFIVPNIEAGNIMGKVLVDVMQGDAAGIIMGTPVPCVMCSRGDTDISKLYTIALGSFMANNK